MPKPRSSNTQIVLAMCAVITVVLAITKEFFQVKEEETIPPVSDVNEIPHNRFLNLKGAIYFDGLGANGIKVFLYENSDISCITYDRGNFILRGVNIQERNFVKTLVIACKSGEISKLVTIDLGTPGRYELNENWLDLGIIEEDNPCSNIPEDRPRPAPKETLLESEPFLEKLQENDELPIEEKNKLANIEPKVESNGIVYKVSSITKGDVPYFLGPQTIGSPKGLLKSGSLIIILDSIRVRSDKKYQFIYNKENGWIDSKYIVKYD